MLQTQTPIYNSRLILGYVEYLRRYYPQVDCAKLLDYAGMTIFEVEDPAHWFTQEQVDRFHHILEEKTGAADISREAGRYMSRAENMGPTRQLALGLMTVKSLFWMLEKLSPLLTRGAEMKVTARGHRKVEIVTRPRPGVAEKPFQCQNRQGLFEGLPRLFTERYATVEHPECWHRGGDCCRYLVQWEPSAALSWRRVRNLAGGLLLPWLAGAWWLLPAEAWPAVALGGLSAVLVLFLGTERAGRRELSKALDVVAESARSQIDEARVRYAHAKVLQEIGRIAAANLESGPLLREVLAVLEQRLGYACGGVWLCGEGGAGLKLAAGYGWPGAAAESGGSAAAPVVAGAAEALGMVIERQKPLVSETPWRLGEAFFPGVPPPGKASSPAAAPRGIVLPLAAGRRTIGILAFLEAEALVPVSATDINFLMAIASLVAAGLNRAAAFRELQQSEAKFRQMLETIQEGYFEADLRGRLTFVNSALCRLTGYGRSELCALRPGAYADRPTRARLKEVFGKVARSGEAVRLARFEFIGARQRPLTAELSVTPVRDDAGQIVGFRGIVRDVGERIRAEREREKLERQLRQVQKLESIGRLAGGIAHNFNNLLMGIQGNVSLINLDIEPGSELAAKTANIEAIVATASKLTSQLLSFARGGKYRVVRLDLNAVVVETSEAFAMTQRNVRVHRELADGLPRVEADRQQIEQLLWNLYVNAADAMPRGGELFLETRLSSHLALRRQPWAVAAGDYVLLRVSDTGCGMDPATLARVFEPFFTTKEVGKGTGLGLASVYGIVKGHAGYIDVESAVGRGTTFYVYLPAAGRSAAPQANAGSAPAAAAE